MRESVRAAPKPFWSTDWIPRGIRVVALGVGLTPILSGSATGGEGPNGFVLEPASVPVDEILVGGPERDGIPALDRPATLPAAGSAWPDDAVVLGVVLGGEARAYPVAILDWHELVNDELAGRPILVSYCPLCGTGIVFDRRVDGRVRRFGVSGLLYRSDLLMYDRESESLWSQISAQAISGPLLGQRLELLRSRMARFGEWKRSHPASTVLSPETGHPRDYARSPYEGYATSEGLAFPVAFERRYHAKMPTLGLRRQDGSARAYPALEILRSGGVVEEPFGDDRVRVAYDEASQVFQVEAPASVEVVEGYWFAWSAFHPETSVYVSPDPKNP
jgi:hypothetical protein